MKNMKRLLAVLLAVLMCLSCLAGMSFADSSKRVNPETELPQTTEGHGIKSTKFQESNLYKYADDEIVTAIVLLEGAAPAELPEAQRAAASNRVAAQHNTLRNALRNAKISYVEEFEYDSLLNGLCISVAYGDLNKIAALSSVKAVHIANHYAAPVVTPSTRMAYSNEMTGAAGFQTAGFKGEGMVVAVLDTGITPGHEAFQVYGDVLANAALSKEDADAFIAEKGYGTYLSDKIPFSYDYYDQDEDATDDQSGHGTHVSGIVAGYVEAEDGAVTFCGTAPYAQLIAMKVFSSDPETGGTNSGIYFAALEDAYELGVDVINMSIGAQNGFTYDEELEDEVFGNIYQTLEENGIILCASAGNESSMAANSATWATDLVTSDYADYGVIGTPSTYDGNMSVASAENTNYPAYIIEAGDRQIAYTDPEETRVSETFGGQSDVEYVVIDGFGEPADFAGVAIKGRIALISRGSITFQEKIDNAAAAGAIGAIIYNNTDGTIGMAVENISIPACSITQEDGEYLKSIAELEKAAVPDEAIVPGDNETPVIPIDNAVGTLRKVNVVNDEEEPIATDLTPYYWQEELQDGDEIVITFEYISEEEVYAVSTAANGNGLASVVVDMEVTDDDYIVYADPAACAFTVSLTEGESAFYLISKDGKYLTSAETGNGLSLTDEPNDYSLWELEEVTSEEGGETYTDGYYFKNVNAKYNDKQQYLEYYNGKITTYSYKEDNDDNYLTFFYVNQDVTPEPPIEPAEPVDCYVGKISFPTDMVIVENDKAWQMSDFSSWGCTPSLTLKPQITGIGGNVWSAAFNSTDGYVLYSGTSMSSPNVAGAMALVSEFVDEKLGQPAADEKENPFVDVADDDWFEEAVMWAVSKEPAVTNGTDDTHFSPSKVCTRAEVVQFLYNAAGKPAVEAPENFAFVDVSADDWFYTAVIWAVQNNVTNGTDATHFSPAKKCTRAEIVQFQWNAAGKPEVEADIAFPDVSADDWFAKAVAWAVSEGITSGTGDGTFAPSKKCSRAEVVQFLYKGDQAAGSDEPVASELSKPERAELAEKLAQSTALVLSDEYETPYSPRKQGSGLINMSLLAAANAYITEPIQNLFDNEDGEFEFTFTVKDLYGNGGTYDLTPVVLADYAAQADLDKNGENETYNTLTSMTLAVEPYEVDGTEYPADVEVDAPETVEVPAGGSVDVTVKIKLTEDTKAYLDAMFPNGTYIEGFIFLDGAADKGEAVAEEIHATYMGFYGDWTKAPILEQHDWREVVDADNFISNTVVDEEGNTYADYGYTYLDVVDFQVTTDVNTTLAISELYYEYLGDLYGGYAGDNLYGYDPEAAFNEDHIAIAPGTGFTDMLMMWPYGLRNARHLVMVATDAETGEIYEVMDYDYMPKADYYADGGFWVSYVRYTEDGGYLFHGTDMNGEYLPNGTKVNITFYGNLAYGDDEIGKLIGEEKDYSKLVANGDEFVEWQFACDIDTEAPVITGIEVDETAGTITVTAKDNKYVSAISMSDLKGEEDYGTALFSEAEEGKEVTATFEIPEDVSAVMFYATDYATNESESESAIIGEPTYVTINFAAPEGTTLVGSEATVSVAIGSKLEIPDLEGEAAKGVFTGLWTDYDFGDLSEYYLDMYYAYGLLELYEVEEKIIVTEDLDEVTLYPVFYAEELIQEGTQREDEPIAGWYFEEDPAEEGWSFVDADGDDFNWTWDDSGELTAYEGYGIISSASYDNDTETALEPDNWAISPAIDLTEINEASLSLWAVGQDDSYAEEVFAVYAGETPNPEEMTKLTDDITAEPNYINTVVDLSSFAGKTIYVAIRHYNVSDMYLLNIDAVEVFDKVVTPDIATIVDAYYTTQPGGETPVPGGDVFAKTTELQDGDKVVIYNPDAQKAISNADSDVESNPERYRLGADVTLTDEGITDPDAAVIWEVEIDEHGIAFKDAEGNYLSVPSNYGNLVLNSDCKYWTVTVNEDGTVFLISTESKGTSGDLRGIEYYQGKFTTFYASETNLTNSKAAFAMELYVLQMVYDD